jgi:hypothetical protein
LSVPIPVVHIEKENKESGKQSTAITDGGRGVKAEKDDSKKWSSMALTKIFDEIKLVQPL